MSLPPPAGPERFDGPATMPVDEAGWWVRERARWIRSRVAQASRRGERLVDVGCGHGAMFDVDALRDRMVVCVDSHRWDEWVPRTGVHYVVAAADALPFRDGAFDLVGSFDVLEHLPNDRRALREQARIVRTGGRVVTAVPADPRLWSIHDERVGHHRRYTGRTYGVLADHAGLTVGRATHFFSFLWLPALLTRRRAVRTQQPGSGDGLLSKLVERAVGVCCAAERRLLGRFDLPVGTSLWFESVRS